MAKNKKVLTDLEEYNCSLMSSDEYSWVLIYDNDTQKTVSGQGD